MAFSSRGLWCVSPLCLTLLLTGCPRMVGTDAGAGVDAGPSTDSGYDPTLGNSYEGPILFDDDRVRGVDPTTLRAGSSPCRAPMLARVQSVSDGDTVNITAEDGTFAGRVRLIGVDTPEIAHPGMAAECYGNEANAFTQALDGHLVWLTFDNTCYDTFGRLLAYTYVGSGEGDFWERQLLRRGYATVLTVGDNRSFSTIFEGDARAAEASNVGLWSACF